MRTVRKALTIAGSDSGGGAGIQADLKTFQELGVYGTSAITAVTAQNTLGVQDIYPMSPKMVAAQIDCIGEDIGTDALKTGMLFSADIIITVAERINHYGWQAIVDPVMIAKGGASLLQTEAVEAVKKYLMPCALVVTPNIPEAEVLTGVRISTEEDKKHAAVLLHKLGAKHVIIKGGHDENSHDSASDLLYNGQDFSYFTSARIPTKNTHGTGCTFSAALTAGIANGESVMDSAKLAKDFIQMAIQDDLNIGKGHGPTNHFAYNHRRVEMKNGR
ncbi:bifunctional hydroxymethylpyrimidine kinase/phosphomethylpyrimidine kinase [Mesobacillus zeae]|uniref:Hydroxymethylpyrimidine/phosphomethylpyrimidine kinase n=2 Tax=Mesobacillus zeae TaxID=1917180 RepID=A0A398AXH6_9BACI|nr:bifunctional hydroxymethylpyrimidine kinase/phosphomethylpyrimidine kinase [Mesobacillus zeae]